jgi:hypothetical protein
MSDFNDRELKLIAKLVEAYAMAAATTIDDSDEEINASVPTVAMFIFAHVYAMQNDMTLSDLLRDLKLSAPLAESLMSDDVDEAQQASIIIKSDLPN